MARKEPKRIPRGHGQSPDVQNKCLRDRLCAQLQDIEMQLKGMTDHQLDAMAAQDDGLGMLAKAEQQRREVKTNGASVLAE